LINYRLGLDVGTNSLGWCVLQIDKDKQPVSMLDWGVRIFDDGREPAKKDIPGESSAVQRRVARGMRRRYDRLIMRRKNTIKQLVKFGLFPEDKNARKELEKLNPLQLRNDAIEKKLTPYETGRALFHLQQRRGFKSNRKDAQKDGNNELAGMKGAIADLEQILESQYTLGQFLYKQNIERKPIRFRSKVNEKGKAEYNFYPSRQMAEDEFKSIWETQQKHNPTIFTEDARKAIHKAIFHQRPLKPQPKGKCSIFSTDTRMDWALPSAQKFRIIKEVNNLAFTAPYSMRGQKLNGEQRNKLYTELSLKNHLTFTQIKKALGSSEYQFNLEVPGRDKIEGDRTAKIMRDEKRFGKEWDKLTLEQQDDIISKIIIDDEKHPDYMDDETLENWLCENYKITHEQANKVVNAPLPDGCASFGKTVISAILPKMEEGMLEYEAIAACGWNHSNDNTGEIYDILPYYGEILEKHVVKNEKSSDPMVRKYGRIGNPTVHIALNQIRRLMNKLKERYGCWPQEIVIEMARNLKNGTKEISKIVKEIDKNTKQREKWKEEIEACKSGAKATKDDYVKMKLWTELATDPTQRKCVYTGKTISQSMLFSGNQVQVDHILPKSRTLDNTSANLVLVTSEGNQIKKNRTPYEAFKNRDDECSYEKVLERSNSLPKSKRWRFFEDAMEIFDSKAKTIVRKSSIDGGEIVIDTCLEPFAARQLNDTSYIAKIGKKYLAYACENGESSVIATPGTLTGLLRKSWGLNDLISTDGEKNRNDHRHHAIDALIVALTTRSMVQRVSTAAAREEKERIKIEKILGEQKPWAGFEWEGLQKRLDEIVVSHKPDHGSPAQKGGGTSGRMHEDTYYGYAGEGKKKGTIAIVVRKPLSSITKFSDLDSVRDLALQDALKNFIGDRDDIANTLQEFSSAETINGEPNIWKGIQRIRMLSERTSNVLVNVQKKPDGSPSKIAVGGNNYKADIYRTKEGKKAGKWQIEFIKTFDINKSNFIPNWKKEFPDAEFIMSLYKGDVVAYEDNGQLVIRKIIILPNSGQISLIPCNLSKSETKTPPSIKVGGMEERRFRKLYIEIDGSVYDPLGILTTKPKEYDAA